MRTMSLVVDLIDLVTKHKSGELRCPATALILSSLNDFFEKNGMQLDLYDNFSLIKLSLEHFFPPRSTLRKTK